VTRPPIWLRVLGLGSLILGAVLVTLTVVTSARNDQRRLQEGAERSLLSAAQAESQALEHYFSEARSIVLLTAQNPALRGLAGGRGSAAVRRDVDDALAYLGYLYHGTLGEASVIDATGEELARVVPQDAAEEDRVEDERAHAFVRETLALAPGEVHQSLPYVSSDTNEWVLSNATPLPRTADRTRALVHFEVSIENFRQSAARSGRDTVTRVVDPGTRRVVFDSRHPQRPGASVGSAAGADLLAAVARMGDARGSLQSVGDETVAIHRLQRTRGNANRWYVVVSPSATSAAVGWKPSAVTVALLTAGLVFLGGAFATFRAYAGTLRRAALTDDLTHLPNRALLIDRARTAILQARRTGRHVAALMLDLNRFKEINDTLGHQEGDHLLLEVAKRLSGQVRSSDTVARLGGDEFLVLAVDLADSLEAVQLAGRIDRALTGPVMLGGVEVDVTASIGIALYPEHGEDVAALLKRADVAMYDAKRARQPYSVYTADLDPYTAERLALVAELRRAIEQRDLRLHYQPKYELGTRRLCGIEALVRWNHPTRGPIAPGEFIPVAEHTGLIRPLTELVLDEALDQVRRWRDAGYALPVSVNLSPRSLLDNDLPRRVGEALEQHGVAAELLCLEITESVIMEDPNRALVILTALDEMGIRLGIDDFGTGYSSLAYLKQLPVAELKIDRSFVMNMKVSEEDAAIVRSTIDLGHNLGLDVVAEGVEDEATLDELARLSCETAQGFFLARPQPPEDISALLAQARAADAA
jgi:diguanylate cyclase (GGDEF)-like protein